MTVRHIDHTASGRSGSALIATGAALFRLLWWWRYRSRHRRALAELDDYMLRDIGLTRREIEAEARKPFWRA